MDCPSYNLLEKSVEEKIKRGEWEECFQEIKAFVETIVTNPFCNGLVLDVPGIDALCQKLGVACMSSHPSASPSNTQEKCALILATELYRFGGHTAVIEDFIKARPHLKHFIVLTDIFNVGIKDEVHKRFADYPVQFLGPEEKSLQAKFRWLQQTWLTLNPDEVYLFNHHQDVVAIAAATPGMPGKLYYYHHIDFQFGLGKRLAHAVHIDIHPLIFHHCRKTVSGNNILLTLTCEDFGMLNREQGAFRKNNKLHTASSGSMVKFTMPYLYSYAELIPAILKSSNGIHTHIGLLSNKMLNHIRKKLKIAKIDPARFHYISSTISLWKTLKDIHVDLYLTSFPVAGGRTCIEVMGSGTPLLFHENYRSLILSEISLVYSEALRWKTPEALLSIIKNITPYELYSHAKLGRRHYETYNQHQYLVERFKGGLEETAVIPLPLSYEMPDASPGQTQLLFDVSTYLAALAGKVNVAELKRRIKKVFVKQ